MPEFATHEQIVMTALATLTLAWLKLMRQKGDPRLRAACGLLAYFLPIAGPLAALAILNCYDRRSKAERLPQRLAASSNLTLARDGA